MNERARMDLINKSRYRKVIELIFRDCNDTRELNDEFFLKHYNYFIELDNKSISEPDFHLKLYIEYVKMLSQKNEVSLSPLITQAISCKIFYKFPNNNYELSYHSLSKDLPKSNRFVIITNRSTSDDKPELIGFDLSFIINLQYLKELKDYIWYSNDDFSYKHAIINAAVRFLELIDKYFENKREEISQQELNIPDEFWLFYIDYLQENYNDAKRKSVFSNLCNYLKFHHSKYKNICTYGKALTLVKKRYLHRTKSQIWEIDKLNKEKLFKSVLCYYPTLHKSRLKIIVDYIFQNGLQNLNDSTVRQQYQYFETMDIALKNEVANVSNGCLYTRIYHKCILNLTFITHLKNISPLLCQALHMPRFCKYYSQEYQFVYYSPYEEPPEYDKFVILPDIKNLSGVGIKNENCCSSNLLVIRDKTFRSDVKEYIWYAPKSEIAEKQRTLCYIVDFINLYDQYIENIVKFDSLDRCLFSHEFIFYYYVQVEKTVDNPSTQKGIIKTIRSYLKFFKTKYNIPESIFDILSLKGLEPKLGGNPMTKKDCSIIYEQIKLSARQDSTFKIYEIVFLIFLLSDLRIGEIVNIERKHIYYDHILLKRKTSANQYVKYNLEPRIQELIKEGKSLTAQYVNYKDVMSKYLFIEPCPRDIRQVRRIKIQQYFKKHIYQTVKDQLEGEYKLNNIRHTYIHSVYQVAIDLGLSLPEISAVTGNSYKTANAYYRNTMDIRSRIEAFSKVSIANTNIKGEILQNEKQFREVERNVGQCKKHDCISTERECLKCASFVTFPSRMSSFMALIEKINLDLEKEDNVLLARYLTEEKILASKYLEKMHMLVNGDG